MFIYRDIHSRLMIFRKCVLEAVFEQIIATGSSHFKVDEMITPSSLNDDTRCGSMFTPPIVRIGGRFLINVPSMIFFFEIYVHTVRFGLVDQLLYDVHHVANLVAF